MLDKDREVESIDNNIKQLSEMIESMNNELAQYKVNISYMTKFSTINYTHSLNLVIIYFKEFASSNSSWIRKREKDTFRFW